jgi:hypothetical protein
MAIDIWFWPGSAGDPRCRGKCCSGARREKQVLCYEREAKSHGAPTAAPRTGSPGWVDRTILPMVGSCP